MDLIDGLDQKLSKSPDNPADEGYLSGRNSAVSSRKIVRRKSNQPTVVFEKSINEPSVLPETPPKERIPHLHRLETTDISTNGFTLTPEFETENREKSDDSIPVNVVSLSDSDEYDTDLDTQPTNTQDIDDKYVCRNTYAKRCEETGAAPQRTVSRDLGRKCLDLTHRNLGPAGMQPICAALMENLRVETLLLEDMGMKDEGCMHLSHVLLDNLVISRLNLTNNGLGYDGARYLSTALGRSKTLLHLNLSDNKLNDDAIIALSKGLAKNDSLMTLNISKNIFGEEGAKALGAAIAENCRLQELNASWNFIRGNGAVGICKSFKENTTLKILHLAWNGLGYEGTVAVSDTLRTNESLRELDISNNRLNWKCADLLAKGLRGNTDLEVLKMGYNPITTTGASAILRSIAHNRSSVRLLDMMNVCVLPESELLALTIEKNRKFQLIHGGVVRTHDPLGQKKEKEIDAMQRILDYMRTLGLRPVEIIREFDKTANFQVSQKDFIARLKSKGIPLHNFELRALAKDIASKGVGNRLNYRKLVDSVNHHVVKERNEKIKARTKKQRREAYHKKLLALRLPSEVLSETEEDQAESLMELRSASTMTQSYSSLHSMVASQRSMARLPSLVSRSNDIESSKQSSRASTALSMTAPLGAPHHPSKKKLTKRKRKMIITQVSLGEMRV